MPFKTEKQRRFLWANEPQIARRWTNEHGSKPVRTPPSIGTPRTVTKKPQWKKETITRRIAKGEPRYPAGSEFRARGSKVRGPFKPAPPKRPTPPYRQSSDLSKVPDVLKKAVKRRLTAR